MLKLLTEWLPLLLAGFATGAVLVSRALARRERRRLADLDRRVRVTQRVVAMIYTTAIAGAYPRSDETPSGSVKLLADLTDLGWLELADIVPSTLMLLVAAELHRRGKDLPPFVLGLLGGSRR